MKKNYKVKTKGFLKEDEKYIRRCIQLSEESWRKGDNPFGCVIANSAGILVEATNKTKMDDATCHAEILAMREASIVDLSNYTIYSNCEPCPMCAFMIREFKFKRVVFAIPSKYMGGYSKWNILEDKDLIKFAPVFSDPPEVICGILEEEARKVFKKANWTM